MLTHAFSVLSPWQTRFEIDGVMYGGQYHAAIDSRLFLFKQHFPQVNRLLELGCLEGGHSIELASIADSIVAIDARDENLRKAEWIAEISGATNIRFLWSNLETTDIDALGVFDVCFNLGLLYHLPAPWLLLRKLAQSCRAMFLWTHHAKERLVNRGGYWGELYHEHGYSDALSGMSNESFWPTRDELIKMLNDCGFADCTILSEEDTVSGPAVTLKCVSQMLGN